MASKREYIVIHPFLIVCLVFGAGQGIFHRKKRAGESLPCGTAGLPLDGTERREGHRIDELCKKLCPVLSPSDKRAVILPLRPVY